MNILFIGDIFGSPGRRIVADHLQDIVATNQIDLAIANAENSAGGFGITPAIAEELFALGLDVLTSGNHIWDKREIYDYLARQPRLLRPANYPEAPGQRRDYVTARSSGIDCAVINLQGRVYMPATDCPFRKADQILRELDPAVKVKFVDFHAEVTSEKMALGMAPGRPRLGRGRHPHPHPDRRHPHSARRHRLPDRLRDDGALRFRDRRADRDRAAALSHVAAGAHGSRQERGPNCTPSSSTWTRPPDGARAVRRHAINGD